MTAPVRIESRAWSDLRFATLARILGLADADHALIKVARLWSWQTEHFKAESPTYVIDRDTIESVLGDRGPEALVRAKLATETPDGWRMHGTEGSIEWCNELAEKRSRAGQARAAGARRGPDGRLMTCNDGYSNPAHAGCAGPAPTSTAPAQSSAPSPDPSPSPDQEKILGALGDLVLAPWAPADAPRPAKPARRKANRAIPEGWTPRPEERAKAKDAGLNVEAEVERFIDHHTAKGTLYADWDAAFRTWIANAIRFSSDRAGPRGSAERAPEQIRKIPTL